MCHPQFTPEFSDSTWDQKLSALLFLILWALPRRGWRPSAGKTSAWTSSGWLAYKDSSVQFSEMSLRFQIEATSGAARAGRLITPHGEVQTPVFMPVGTLGSVKGVSQEILEELGVEILLGNTYHLYLR